MAGRCASAGLAPAGSPRPMNDLPNPVRALLESDLPATLVTLNSDGSPHVTVAWVGLEDDEIVIGTLSDQPKLRNIRRDPNVALSLLTDTTNHYGLREYVVLRGHARITEGGAAELLQRLARVYLGPEVVFPSMPNPPPGFVTRITVERIGGVGPWAQG
jgi:PPOX class probable F420-dependent enzyme